MNEEKRVTRCSLRYENMKWFSILLSLGLAQITLSNPKVDGPNILLLTERVNVSIQGDTAQVHGFFRFQQGARPEPIVPGGKHVYFPLVVPKNSQPTVADFKFSLELDGRKAVLYAIASKSPVNVPASEAYSLVWILATVPGEPIDHKWGIRVSYEQKLLDGVFYYLPILQKTRSTLEGLEIQVRADRPIQSSGKRAGMVISLGANDLLFTPVNLNMIAVSAPTS